MKPIKEVDYLYASGRIRALEGALLTRERANRMIDAKTLEEAFRQLADCGYDSPAAFSPEALEQVLSAKRVWLFDTIAPMIPEKRMVDTFRVRYDIHNIKVLLKARDLSPQIKLPFQDFGRVPADRLTVMVRESDLRNMPKTLATAVAEAGELLARTGDPQLMDIHLDRVCLKEMLDLALAINSPFLAGYIRLLIDATNLRILVRIQKMGNKSLSLGQALIPGGNIPLEPLIQGASESGAKLGSVDNPVSGDGLEPRLEQVFAASPLKLAAAAGTASLRNNTASRLVDGLCDNCLMAYLHPARQLAFGHQLVVAFLIATESEITAIRSILTGKIAGQSPESIRERIREHYV